MSGNSIGKIFRVTTWGESHGPAIGAVVDGCPAGLHLSVADIQRALDRRKAGGLPSETSRREADQVEVLSGVFQNRTTGTPISLIIHNREHASGDYESLKNLFRPGHGDFTYTGKYGFRDYRGGGRASGRETAARVAAGAIAEKFVRSAGLDVMAHTVMLGGIWARGLKTAQVKHEEVDSSRLKCLDGEAEKLMLEKLEQVRMDGDTLGGIVEIVVRGCPIGLGEPVCDKLDADLAKALMSIGTVKGVEMGDGFAVAAKTGSENNDLQTTGGYLTNHAGGILAGIANGNDIVLRVACKPIPSIAKTQRCLDADGRENDYAIKGRHDLCVIPRVIPVCEAMVWIILADHLLRNRATRL
ncbi:MAG: chorismate synthase [Deltaproteobacteria bacterium]|nr:chorismate synthase [Deltaproteobacteria bacterium]